MNIIFAIDQQGGYAKNNEIPWKNKDDMIHFKASTINNVVIMGHNTWMSLPKRPLKNRINIVVSRLPLSNAIVFPSLSEAFAYANQLEKSIWVIGGGILLHESLCHPALKKLYITHVDGSYDCDKLFQFPFDRLQKIQEDTIPNGKIAVYVSLIRVNYGEILYLKLAKKILQTGNKRNTRNGVTTSIFGEQLKINLAVGFPLLTTKKMFWRGIVEELLMFINGDTNTKLLEEKNINIWKQNTSKTFIQDKPLAEGDMGPMYGFQWRHFGETYIDCNSSYNGYDQLYAIVQEIKTNPSSRRLIFTTFNPIQANDGVLYPCHSLVVQFYVEDKKLSCHMYQRSGDYMLGVPFNIASSALLTHIVANLTDLDVGELCISFGDVHLYEQHIAGIKEQLTRYPYEFPSLIIKHKLKLNMREKLSCCDRPAVWDDFLINNYTCYNSIKVPMIA